MQQNFDVPTPSDIKKWRLRLKLTQAELARLANVSQPLITRIERGDVDPRLSTFQNIINALSKIEQSDIGAKSLMSSPVVTARPDDTVKDVAKIMIERGFSQLPLASDDSPETPIGVVSDKCIIQESLSMKNIADVANKTARDIMQANLPMVNQQTDVSKIARILEEKPAVLVVGKEGIQGIITKADLMKLIRT